MYLPSFTYALLSILTIILSPRLVLAQKISVETIKFDCQSIQERAKNQQSFSSCFKHPLILDHSEKQQTTSSEYLVNRYSFTQPDLPIKLHFDEYSASQLSGNFRDYLGNNIIADQASSNKKENLRKLQIPNADVPSVLIANWYNTDFHNLEDQNANTIVTRVVIPFTTGKIQHLSRINIPINTHNPFTNSGLSDISVFNLINFYTSIGKFAIGPILLIPSGGNSRGYGKWAIGPAIMFSRTDGKLTWGVFNQNVFNIASINGANDRPDVNASLIQPILTYDLGKDWSISSSEMLFTYNWDSNKWIALPLGIRINKIVKVAEQPIQFHLQYEHNFADDQIAISNTVRFGIRFIFPPRN